MKLVVFGIFIASVHLTQASSWCSEHFERLEADTSFYSSYNYYTNTIAGVTLICYNATAILNLTILPSYDYGIHRANRPVTNIRITESNVTTLPDEGFLMFPDIKKLYLSDIHVKAVETEAFKNLSKLRELHLDGNELTEMKDVFSPLTSLELLDLSRNRIRYINTSYLTKLTNLKDLNLADNFLTEFDYELPLRYLDLSRNPLRTVSKVRDLDVEKLSLANISLDEFMFDLSNGSVKTLNLSSNLLSSFDFSLVPLVMIQVDLSNNSITSLENYDSTYVEYIDLSNNGIRTLNASFYSLREFNLSGNKIEALQNNSFKKSGMLTNLLLGTNEISKIDRDAFNTLRELQRLDLNHNSIPELPLGVFTNLAALEYLDLSWNRITKLTYFNFVELDNLKTLNLSNNALFNLDSQVLPLLNLNVLRLDNNRLSYLDVNWSVYRSLRYISVDGNPWICENLAAFTKAIKHLGEGFQHGEYYDGKNVFGVACVSRNSSENSSELSLRNFHVDIQKAIDDDLDNSQISRYLNWDFPNLKDRGVDISSEIADDSLFVVMAVQFVISCLLLLVVCLMYVFLNRLYHRSRIGMVASRLELVISE